MEITSLKGNRLMDRIDRFERYDRPPHSAPFGGGYSQQDYQPAYPLPHVATDERRAWEVDAAPPAAPPAWRSNMPTAPSRDRQSTYGGQTPQRPPMRPTLQGRLRQVWDDFKLGLRITPLMTYLDWALSAALGITALLVGSYNADTVSIWYDESWSYGVATIPVSGMIHYFLSGFENMMSYFLFVHFWLKLAAFLGVQPNELYLRVPSVLAIALSVVVLYHFGRRFFGRVAGLVAAVCYLLNFTVLYDAQQARSYAFEMLFVILSWYALLVALSANEQSGRSARIRWLLYIAATILCVYTHLFTVLVIATQALALGFLLVTPGPWRERTRAALKPLIASFVGIGVCSLPILAIAFLKGDPNSWVPVPTPKDIYTLLLILTEGNITMSLWYLSAGLIVLGLLIAALNQTSLIKRMDTWKLQLGSRQAEGKRPLTIDLAPVRAPSSGVSVIIFWMAGPILLSYITTQKAIGQHFFYPRYENVVVPALCLLVGIGISSLRWRVAQVGLGALLLVLLIQSTPYYYQHAQIQDFRTPVLWLKAHYQSVDGIVCAGSYSCAMPTLYYLQVYPPKTAQFDDNSPGAFSWATRHSVAADPATLANYSAQHTRVFVVAFGSSAIVAPILQWYATHYPQIGRMLTRTVSVYLYDTSAPPKASGGG